MGRNVATFLWRTLYLRTIRGPHYATVLQVLVVTWAAFVNVVPLKPEKSTGNETLQLTDLNKAMLTCSTPSHVLFGPKSDYNELLMRTAVEDIQALRANEPPTDPQHLYDPKNCSGPSRIESDNATEYITVESAEAVADACMNLLPGEDDREAEDVIPLCVALVPQPDTASPASLQFTLVKPVRLLSDPDKEFSLGTSFNKDPDLGAYIYFIEKAHLELQTPAETSTQEMTVKVGALPGEQFTARYRYAQEILLTVVYVFLVPLVLRIRSIELEFSSGLAEHQGVMGLTDAEFYCGHFLTSLCSYVLACAVVVGFMHVRAADGISWANGVDISLLIFSFLLFALGFSLQTIMITWIFPKGIIALILGFLIMVMTPTFAKSFTTTPFTVPDLFSYLVTPKWEKLTFSLFPVEGIFSVMRIIRIYKDFKKSADWSIVSERALGLDNVTIVDVWGMMLLSDLGMAFLAWYLHKVLPWSTNNPQSPIFFLKPSYWKQEGDAIQEAVPAEADAGRFEQLPPDQRIVIVTNDLRKVYGQNPALNGVNLKVCESKVTVLLGHNGTGKTTLMTILTGMQAPSGGMARVCGYDVATNRAKVRQLVSFCQQTDIFFDYMTCLENLLYFGSLKGKSSQEVLQSIESTLYAVDLMDKLYSYPSDLSGGMKRRMSIAMTIVSQPKVLVLDEPTTGLDPETRRKVWDVLQAVAKERTVLLSSHDMEEADAIGDQVVIMASGRVICSGSTSFLKKACGIGYKLTLVKSPKGFSLKDALEVIQKNAPGATVEDEKQSDATIALNTMECKQFPVLFKALEGSSNKLGIESMGVSVATMKDVYLKMSLDWVQGGKAQELPVDEEDIDVVCAPITKQRTMLRVFCALFVKRSISLVRSWSLLISSTVLPLTMLALFCWLTPLPSGQTTDPLKERNVEGSNATLHLRLADHHPGSVIVVGESPASKLSEGLRVLVESEGSSVRRTVDVDKEIDVIAKEDFAKFITTYLMAARFENHTITLLPNPTSKIAIHILVNLLHTARLREVTSQTTAFIRATIVYRQGPVPYYIQESYLQTGEPSNAEPALWLYWMFAPALFYSLAFAAYAAFPASERLCGARDAQLMTGMWGAEFVFAHFIFDMMHHSVFSALWCLVHFAFSNYSPSIGGHYFFVFLCSGPAVIGAAYLIAEKAASLTAAIHFTVTIMYFLGVSSALAKGFVAMIGFRYADTIFLLFPPYALLSSLVKTSVAGNSEMTCSEDLRKLKNATTALANYISRRGSLLHGLSGKSDKPSSIPHYCQLAPLLSLEKDGIGYEILALLLMGIVFLGLMTFLTSGYLPPADAYSGKEVLSDEDVEAEKKLIDSFRSKQDFSSCSMLAWNLHKRYGDIRPVRGVYLGLRPSECFGLLGVNGAGKTTTFQMLSGLESVTFGDAMTEIATLSQNVRKWQSQISYCVQIGGLLERLNAYEYLYLIGRLRGISDVDLQPMVESMLSVVDLKEHASKECGVYSGGNQRKLSIAAALLGLPPFIFLDEPYAGVDVMSRNKIFRGIEEIKKRSKSCFMLTSHNMDECEFSCDRLTIMVEGQMMCLGTLQHLREKFGGGYWMEFMLKHTAAADSGRLAQAVEKLFPGVKITDTHQNVLCYHLEQRIPWSTLFKKIVQLQKDFDLEHALVGENTLEQIFLAFAKTKGMATLPGQKTEQQTIVSAGSASASKSTTASPAPSSGIQT